MSGPTKTQGEHTFAEDILISGEEIRGYSAAADLDRAEPVEVVGDYQVDSAPAGGGAFVGIVAYNVADGQEVAILGDDCEVRLEAAEAVTPETHLPRTDWGPLR